MADTPGGADMQDSTVPGRIPIPDSADVPEVVRERHDVADEVDVGQFTEAEVRELAARRLGARDALHRARRTLHRAGPQALAQVLDGMLGEPMERILAELDRIADEAVKGGARR
jgi:hypothetical protein